MGSRTRESISDRHRSLLSFSGLPRDSRELQIMNGKAPSPGKDRALQRGGSGTLLAPGAFPSRMTVAGRTFSMSTFRISWVPPLTVHPYTTTTPIPPTLFPPLLGPKLEWVEQAANSGTPQCKSMTIVLPCLVESWWTWETEKVGLKPGSSFHYLCHLRKLRLKTSASTSHLKKGISHFPCWLGSKDYIRRYVGSILHSAWLITGSQQTRVQFLPAPPPLPCIYSTHCAFPPLLFSWKYCLHSTAGFSQLLWYFLDPSSCIFPTPLFSLLMVIRDLWFLSQELTILKFSQQPSNTGHTFHNLNKRKSRLVRIKLTKLTSEWIKI